MRLDPGSFPDQPDGGFCSLSATPSVSINRLALGRSPGVEGHAEGSAAEPGGGGREVIAASSASVKWMKEGVLGPDNLDVCVSNSSSSSWQPPQLHLAAHVV